MDKGNFVSVTDAKAFLVAETAEGGFIYASTQDAERPAE